MNETGSEAQQVSPKSIHGDSVSASFLNISASKNFGNVAWHSVNDHHAGSLAGKLP